MGYSYSGGLWLPDGVMARYSAELHSTAAALLKFYDELHDGHGQLMMVPIEKMLAALQMSDTPECRKKLRSLVHQVGHEQNVGTRIEHGVVSVWFTRDVAENTRSYQRLPAAFPTSSTGGAR